MFWGVSPALDLQEEYLKLCESEDSELNLLVIGGCDARHILKTLAQSYRYSPRRLNFYVVDGCPEITARQLLLLSMAFEKVTYVGLMEKTRRFLEIYGNLLLRPSTSQYLTSKSKQLINMITNPDNMANLLPSITINNLKYRERDYIEELMKFWSTGNTNLFDVCYLWDRRIRQHLGVRYDTKNGVFDWDYHMRMKDIARQICWPEYKHFREHGVAFTWLETEVCRPNCSLVAGVYKCGERFLHRGYLGDMVCSPYISYGLDCEDTDMVKESHGTNFKRATDVAERNVMRMFYELENGKRFDTSSLKILSEQNLGMVVLQNIDAKISEDADDHLLKLEETADTYINLKNQINFLSLSCLDYYPLKPEYQNFFNGVFIGQTMFSRTKQEIFSMMRNDAFVIFETRKYFVDNKRQDLIEFGDKIKEMATAAELSLIGELDGSKTDFGKFLKNRKYFENKNEETHTETSPDFVHENQVICDLGAAGEPKEQKNNKTFEIYEDPEPANEHKSKIEFEIFEDGISQVEIIANEKTIGNEQKEACYRESENITIDDSLECDKENITLQQDSA